MLFRSLKKYVNSKTKISYVPDYILDLKDNVIVIRGNSKILEFTPAGLCRISHIKSTAEFYIQLESDILKLRDINEDLKRNENNFVTIEAKERKICVVMNQTTNEWQRAHIISIDENGIKVKLIDYGNDIVVQQIYSSDSFSSLRKPPIAQKYCLRLFSVFFTSIVEKKFQEMSYTKGGGLMNINILKLGSFNVVELFQNSYSIADNLISSQFEDCRNISDSHDTSYNYRASMDDNELADFQEYN